MAAPTPAPGWHAAIQEKPSWRVFIEQPAQRLQEFLYEATGDWGATCAVCDSKMTRGAQDHLQSQGHWRNIWKRLDNKIPSPDRAAGFSGPWVQVFEVPVGQYYFNHLTGEQELRRGGAPTPSAAPAVPPQVPAQPQPQPIAQPPLQQAQAANMWEDDDDDGAQVPMAPVFSQAPLPSVAPAPKVDIAVSSCVAASSTSYRDALNDRQVWRRHMEIAAKVLEDVYHASTGQWGGTCPVCDIEMTRGVSDHLPSQNHWKKLWQKLNKVPEPSLAHDWSRPWIERFKFPAGEYLFNHVTGAQGFEAAIRQASADGGAAAGGAEATRAAAANVAATGVAPAGRPSDGQQRPAAAKFDLAAFVWERHVRESAQRLERLLEQWGQESVSCGICGTPTSGVAEHVASAAHFRLLEGRMAALATMPSEEKLADGPWVQVFRGSDGAVARFNHVTGTLEVPGAA